MYDTGSIISHCHFISVTTQCNIVLIASHPSAQFNSSQFRSIVKPACCPASNPSINSRSTSTSTSLSITLIIPTTVYHFSSYTEL